MAEDIYIIIIVATLVFFVLTFSVVYLGVVHTRRTAMYRQELLRAQIEIKEQTLQDIARELHDNLGQVASLIKINLHTMNLNDRQKSESQLEGTRDLVRQLLSDLKMLSVSLNNERIADVGLLKGLETETERLNKTGEFQAELSAEGGQPNLDANTCTILYRMCQEILNNMMKHSKATRVTISSHASENLFRLVFRDNGVGFNYQEKKKSGGSGLTNLYNRARMINANLTFDSQPGQGTMILIEMPL